MKRIRIQRLVKLISSWLFTTKVFKMLVSVQIIVSKGVCGKNCLF